MAFWEAYGEIHVRSSWIQGLKGSTVGTYSANCLWSRLAKKQLGNMLVGRGWYWLANRMSIDESDTENENRGRNFETGTKGYREGQALYAKDNFTYLIYT